MMLWELKVDNLYTHIKSNNRMYALIKAKRMYPKANEIRVIKLIKC